MWRRCFAKNTAVVVLKMRYRYIVIEFACSSSTVIWRPEKRVTDVLSQIYLQVDYRFDYRYLKF